MVKWLVALSLELFGLLTIVGAPHVQRHAIAYYDRNKAHPIHSKLGTRKLVEGSAYLRAMRVVGFGWLLLGAILLRALLLNK